MELHPEILPRFHAAGVQHILHAGDICAARVLTELRQLCPVTAVQGNRDMFAGPLAMIERLDFAGTKVTLMHGHGGLWPYLWDKWQFWLFGYNLNRYINLLIRDNQDARVIVYGHTHHPLIKEHQGQLLVNPGSASFGIHKGPPSIGLLRVMEDNQIEAEILPLLGYAIQNRRWVKLP